MRVAVDAKNNVAITGAEGGGLIKVVGSVDFGQRLGLRIGKGPQHSVARGIAAPLEAHAVGSIGERGRAGSG